MSIRLITVLLVAASATACAHRPTYDPADPLEPVNRKIFAFNNTVDRYVAEPVARTYVKVVQRVPVKLVFDPKPDEAHRLVPGMSVVPTVDVARAPRELPRQSGP